MKRILTLLFASLAMSICVSAQSEDAERFTIDNPFKMTLHVDFEKYRKNAEEDKFTKADIHYTLDDGTEMEKEVKVKTRGNWRRRNCDVPPIRIKFGDDDYRVELLDGLKSVKMVDPCSINAEGQQCVIKEYLIYKSYELFTEYSLKTYFLEFEFINKKDENESVSGYAFLIEDIDDLSKRVDAEEVGTMNLLHHDLNEESEATLSLFQFMIGNTDWALLNLHNMKLLELPDAQERKYVAVPYDFDFSGLVNTDYSKPAESLPIETVRERFYLGNCQSDEKYQQLFTHFKSKRSDLYALYRDCSLLQDAQKEEVISYLDEFYAVLDDPKAVKNQVYKRCFNPKKN